MASVGQRLGLADYCKRLVHGADGGSTTPRVVFGGRSKSEPLSRRLCNGRIIWRGVSHSFGRSGDQSKWLGDVFLSRLVSRSERVVVNPIRRVTAPVAFGVVNNPDGIVGSLQNLLVRFAVD